MKALKTLHGYDLSLFNRLNPVRLNEDFIRFNRYIFGRAFLVGVSRNVLGVHFPADTFVSMSLGVSTAFISMEIVLS